MSKNSKCQLIEAKRVKAGLSCIFWRMCLHSPLNVYAYSGLVLVEELLKMTITFRLSFRLTEVETFYQDLFLFPDLALYLLYISCGLLGFFVMNFLLMWYQYKTVLRIGKKDSGSAFLQISFKFESLFFALFGTFLQFACAVYLVFQIYAITICQTPQMKNIYPYLILLEVILIIVVLTLYALCEKFLNIEVINKNLVYSRPEADKFLYFKPIQLSLIAGVSLQQNITYVGILLSLLAILSMGGIQIYRTCKGFHYYNRKLDKITLYLKQIKVAYFISQLVMGLFSLTYQGFIYSVIITMPILFGICHLVAVHSENQALNLLFKDSIKYEDQYEYVIYILLYAFQKKNQTRLRKYFAILMSKEDSLNKNEESYYYQISQIIKHKNKSQDEKQNEVLDNEEIMLMPSFYTSFQNLDRSQTEAANTLSTVTAPKYSQCQLANIFSQENIIDLVTEELQKSKAEFIEIEGIQYDISDIDSTIKQILVKFFFTAVLKNAIKAFPKSRKLLFLQAFAAMELLKNRHITIQSVSNVHSIAKRQSFVKQVEAMVTENFFIHHQLLKINPNHRFNIELEVEIFKQQSLEMEKILDVLKNATILINLFWKALLQHHLSSKQIISLIQTSEQVSEKIEELQIFMKNMGQIDSFQSSCQSLYYYFAQFSAVVLRDSFQSNEIIRQGTSIKSMKIDSTQRHNQIDSIGLITVDGNFTLNGKIVFVNKTITKSLGYLPEEMIGQKIHMLMPTVIAENHNIYWNRFSEVGQPKVLEKTRFLFTKDKQGYIIPLKIFIKLVYHPIYEYCFIGVFRKPQQINFYDDEDYPPVRLKKSYQLICNNKGIISDISRSFQRLTGLTPKILESLHLQLQNHFRLSDFNKDLDFDWLNLQQHSCITIKLAPLNLSILGEYTREIETNEILGQQMFQSLSNKYNASVKIVSEIYGVGSRPITLYYVFIAELDCTYGTLSASQNVQFTAQKTFLSQDSYQSENQFESSKNNEGGKQVTSQSSAPIEQMSVSSVGSTSSAISSQIKNIEEESNYLKTPKPLILIRISITLLFLISAILSVIQFSLNKQSSTQTQSYQQILFNTIESKVEIQDIILLVRSYLNVQMGIIDNQNQYLPDRQQVIRYIGLEMIESVRLNLIEYEQFIIQNKLEQSNDSKYVDIYSLNKVGSITYLKQQSFTSLNSFLISIQDLFLDPHFNSTMFTYLLNKTADFTNDDETVFSIFTNLNMSIKGMFEYISNDCQNFIESKISSTQFTNKIYLIVSSSIIFLLIAATVFFSNFVNTFKLTIIQYFAELDKELIQSNEKCSSDYQEFMRTTNMSILKQNFIEREQFYQSRQEKRDKEIQDKHHPFQQKQVIEEEHKQEEDQSIHEEDIEIEVKTSKQKKQSNKKKRRDEIKHKFKIEISSLEGTFNDQNNSKMQLTEKAKPALALNTKNVVKIQEIQDEGFSFKDFKKELKQVARNYLIKLVGYGILCFVLLFSYSLLQYFFSNMENTTKMESSSKLPQIYSSYECNTNFILASREFQISNQTILLMNNQIPNQKITFSFDQQGLNNLNNTYQKCIQQDQEVYSQLIAMKQSILNFQNQSICDYISKLEFNQINASSCYTVMQGIFSKNVIQAQSGILQSVFQQDILFANLQIKTQKTLKNFISGNKDSTDAYLFFLSFGLRNLYHEIGTSLLQGSGFTDVIFGIFIGFVIIMLLLITVVNCITYVKIRKQFWRSFYILRILPKDELEIDYIRKLNEWLATLRLN